MIKHTSKLIILFGIIFIIASCKKKGADAPPPPLTEFQARPQAALLDIAQKIDPDDISRQLYSARHILEVSGVPYFETSDINKAMEASMILISSPIDVGLLTSAEVTLFNNWVDAGGVIISPVCEDLGMQSLFGFSGSPSYHKNRYYMSWVNEPYPELSYFDHENEKTISFGKNSGGNNVIKSYGYSLSGTSKALAYFDSDEAAVIRNNKGQGRTYLFGVEWRDVIQRPQLNRDFEAQRIYINGFEPSADVFALFVRSVWNDIQPAAAWKHTIPNGYKTVLILTHDVDATSGYNLMGHMSDYEKSMGFDAMFFITTRYFGDDLAKSPYYNTSSIELAKKILVNGHTLGSHSVGHFPDMSNDELFPRGTMAVTKETYNPAYIDGNTKNATTYGEIKVADDLIRADFNVNLRSFRPGHLLTNSFVTEGLSDLNYSFHSSFTACDLLTGYPFYERTGQDWGGRLTQVMQIPIHISDSGITRENYLEKAATWHDVLLSHQNNYTPCVLLIHPTRKWKTESQKVLVDKINREDCGVYSFEGYGDFWKSRSDFRFEFDYQEEGQQFVIKASKDDIFRASKMGLMVESKMPIKNYRLIDSDFTEYPLSVKAFSDGRSLVVIE